MVQSTLSSSFAEVELATRLNAPWIILLAPVLLAPLAGPQSTLDPTSCPHCSRLGQDGPGLLAANRLGFPNDEHVAVSPAAHAPAPCSHALHHVYAGAHWTCLATLRNASHASNEFEPGTTGHLRLSRPCKCCRARARPR